jgi:hypothetical protein
MLRSLHVNSIEIHLIIGVAAGLGLPLATMFVFDAIGFQYGFTFPKRKATTLEGEISRRPSTPGPTIRPEASGKDGSRWV